MFQSVKWIFVIGNNQLSNLLRHVAKVKLIWQKWNLRSFILFSIVVQIFLVFAAPLRKKTASKTIITIIWAAYLIADWAASFAVGLIFDSEEKYTASGAINNTVSFLVTKNHGIISTLSSKIRDDTGLLLVMWTPFLLLLVGGQDRITSYAVEDNELWLRHLIWLLLQIVTTCFVFYQSFHLNNLWVPTICLLLAGTIKYVERVAALYLASSDSLGISVLREPDPGPNYERLMSAYTHYKGNNLPIKIEYVNDVESETAGEKSSDTVGRLESYDLVQRAHHFAYIYKGLIVNLMFSSREHTESREFFTKRSAEQTLKILEIQLNYFYDLLHTKVLVATSPMGIATRIVSTGLVVASFALFLIIEEKGTFEQTFDVFVTYALFFGVLGLDMVTLLFWFYSDWTVAYLKNFDKKSLRFKIINNLLSPKKVSLLSKIINNKKLKQEEQSKKDSLLIKIINKLKLPFLKKQRQKQPLRIKKLLEKSYFADDSEEAKRISSARGEWILENDDFDYSLISSKLMPYVKNVAYDESLQLWHIATELCYNNTDQHSHQPSGHQPSVHPLDCEYCGANCSKKCRMVVEFWKKDDLHSRMPSGYEQCDAREFSKRLSDYMFYLLYQQQGMVSEVSGISKLRFKDTSSEASRFFSEYKGNDLVGGCKNMLKVNTSVKPVHVKGDRSKSVLFDACMLAKEIEKLSPEIKWKLTSKVWVELLSYAASRSRAKGHIQQLSKGGELYYFCLAFDGTVRLERACFG
ncbi:uncharacterized protein LOC115980182 [Quercus lobata]|uniref:uncharacterized protein LOC115980182 n=1 Tax=Quercus lobata TaxID=97700 RepID=UPI0012474744|nr:uncharacterized protein LOC115980182 [Quercus lobata]